MSYKEPVFVIHGVNNRDQSAFEAQVGELEESVNDIDGILKFVPVYWGDIGEQDINIVSTIPNLDYFSVRSGDDYDKIVPDDISFDIILSNNQDLVVESERLSIVTESGSNAIENQNDSFVDSDEIKQQIIEAIEEYWFSTSFLNQISSRELLEQIGDSIGSITIDYANNVSCEYETRGWQDNIKEFCGKTISTLDKQIGSVLGKTMGNWVSNGRNMARENAAFLSDILVYQRHGEEILERVRNSIADEGIEYGTQQKPINVIAHSFGGIISFDLAVLEENPLWINKLMTFGSQVALFHILDPRGGVIPRYDHQNRITLPSTINKWTNFWAALDPLAFSVSNIFQLSSGEIPNDIGIKHRISDLNVHGFYWQDSTFRSHIRYILNL